MARGVLTGQSITVDETTAKVTFSQSGVPCQVMVRSSGDKLHAAQYQLADIYTASERTTLITLLKKARDKLLTDEGFPLV